MSFANFIGPLRPQRRSGSSEEGMEPSVQPLHHQNIDLKLHLQYNNIIIINNKNKRERLKEIKLKIPIKC
jgi:hypothetical protein